jgi:GAF domain-containing protein
MPATVNAELFGAESLAQVTAKFAVVDALLRLTTRDCKFPDFMREVLLVPMRVVKCEAGSLLEVDPSSKTLFFRAVVGQSSDRVAEFVIPMGQGIAGHVAESRQPVHVQNVAENKMHLKAIQDAVGFEARNMIAVPIVVRGQTFAVLELLNRVGEPNFTAADLELLDYFCEMASKAIEARLMISWQKRQQVASGKKAA